MSEPVDLDVAVIGGGIAGLWLLNRLRSLGYDAVLFEKNFLGQGQTIASQGIIHSGLKYAFDGVDRPQTETLSSMPRIWMDCIAGRGEVDLRGTEVLAEHQLLFTQGGMLNRLAGAFATKALRSEVGAVERGDRPPIFQTPEFHGQVYRLQEPVLAAKSVVDALRRQGEGFVHRASISRLRSSEDGATELVFEDGSSIRPRACIVTSGEGNEWFAEQLGLEKSKVTQRRPLRMFLARGISHKLFAHCLVPEPKPRVTITSHDFAGENVWYLGGNIAEKAVGMQHDQAVRWADAEMKELFPWLDWKQVRWAVHDVNRAEPQASKLLPGGPTLTTVGNVALAWPTKLALAPSLTLQALRWLEQLNVTPSRRETKLSWPAAEAAKYPWEEAKQWIRL